MTPNNILQYQKYVNWKNKVVGDFIKAFKKYPQAPDGLRIGSHAGENIFYHLWFENVAVSIIRITEIEFFSQGSFCDPTRPTGTLFLFIL